MNNVTTTLLLASFIMCALISVKIIDNKDTQILRQEKAIKSKDSLMKIQSDNIYSLDSMVQCIPDYIPKDEVMRLYWENKSN